MSYAEQITPRQLAAIKKIERHLGFSFEGETKRDASEFIGEYMDESMRVGKGPITASQAELIAQICEALEKYRITFTGDKYEDAVDFIFQYHDMARAIIIDKLKEDKKRSVELCADKDGEYYLCINGVDTNLEDACGHCGDEFPHEYGKFYHYEKPYKLCSSCYEVYEKERREKKEAESVVEAIPFVMGASEEATWHTSSGAVKKPREPKKAETQRATPKTTNKTKTNQKKVGNKMFNFKSIMGDFGKVTDGQFKLSFQGLAIATGDDSYAVYDAEEHRMIDVMDFVADAEGMIYKMPAQINQLGKGDVIIVKNKPLIVKSVNGNSIRALNPISNNETTHKPAGNLFGIQFITKVVSMFELMQNPQAGGQQAFNPMMLMLMNKDDDSSMSDLLPLMMMSGQGGQMNNMLPFLLMSGKGDGESGGMMEMMLMSQMMGGQQQGGFNFGNMFGAPAPAPTQAPVTPVPDTNTQDIVQQVINALNEINASEKVENNSNAFESSAE